VRRYKCKRSGFAKSNTAQEQEQQTKIARKVYLDGLRGWVALMVLLSHGVAGFFLSLKLAEEISIASIVVQWQGCGVLVFLFLVNALTEAIGRYNWANGFGRLVLKRFIRLGVPVFLAVLFA